MTKDRSLEMLGTALAMEEKGISFYREAFSTCKNNLGREIYKMLKNDERIHIERINRIYSSLKEGNEWNADWKDLEFGHGELNEFFVDLAKRHTKDISVDSSDIEALEVGVDFELKSIDFYKEHLKISEDPLEREFLEHMIKEERGHYKILDDMKLYLKDPDLWFMEKERSGLDGA